MLRVLVVDDSAFMRRLITTILSADAEIDVIGQAKNGAEAIEMTAKFRPDVLTLDVEMPGVDGFQALQAIMQANPTPVVMLSSLTMAGAEATIRCLELGAVDFVAKPSGSISLDLYKVGAELMERVKAAAQSKIRLAAPGLSTQSERRQHRELSVRPQCVFIGSSTGGPRALQQVVPKLPIDLGLPVVIVQHMPPGFTTALAARLDAESALRVRQARPGDQLEPNTVLVAPGGLHMEVVRNGYVRMNEGASVNGVRPAADITLGSMVDVYGGAIVGVLLTGMGRDGAAAMKRLHDASGHTVAESQETCVVYGMPRAAVELGAVDVVLPLHEIANEISRASHLTRMAS
ncbi:MAG TPA: chemotaxis response regulator protein-glutamate methylesterase [Fimbriimonadaceae bacterium]|nr:chemotaxis response regulator protein-glutamate methylesterase [Fimbriimonadaceae bacterium]